MTEWKKEICGTEYPLELEQVSRDTYIERKNITYVEGDKDEMQDIGAHYECLSRFITKDEYNMLNAVAGAVDSKRESEIIDAYTLQLIEEGVI